MTKLTTLALASCLLLLFSCRKDTKTVNQTETSNARFPTTEKEKERVAAIKEVAQILKDVYLDAYAYHEVNAAIFSGFYEDERVLLKDLLFPETSALYQTSKFRSYKARSGAFKARFNEALNKGNFPVLKRMLSAAATSASRVNSLAVGEDPEQEIFSRSNGICIYFPYSEDYFSTVSQSYLDNINQDPRGPKATIVAADRDADAAPGEEPYICGTRDDMDICFRNVTVNDDYAASKATHIVGVGAEPARVAQDNSTPVSLVFIGEAVCKNQYDRLISFTGNGGGSEIMFVRGDAYLTLTPDQQVTAPQDVIPKNFSRKDIRNNRWKSVYSIWDSNWEPDNTNQVFAIYEEDTQGTSTISLALETTVTVQVAPVTVTQKQVVGFNIQVKTQDAIIRQIAWNRESFYLFNQGTLNNNCGVRNGWTVYDCNLGVAYTMPQQ